MDYLDKEINRANTQISQGTDSNEYGCYFEYFTYLKALIEEENKYKKVGEA